MAVARIIVADYEIPFSQRFHFHDGKSEQLFVFALVQDLDSRGMPCSSRLAEEDRDLTPLRATATHGVTPVISSVTKYGRTHNLLWDIYG